MLAFTEPDLAFALRRHDGEKVVLRVRVGHRDADVTLHLTTSALRDAVTDWDRELAAYPRR